MLGKLLALFPEFTPRICGQHVGETFPFVSATILDGMSWSEVLASGSVARAIAGMARERNADLIVMATNGRDTFSQKLIGSITEQVLRDTPCPVLAVAVPE